MAKALFSNIGFRYSLTQQGYSMVSYLSKISMAGLVLSVAILIVVKAVMNGFDYELRTRILGVVPHASIEGDMQKRGWQHYQKQLTNYSFVQGAAPFIQVDALARRGRQALPMILKGVSTELEPSVSRIREYSTVSLGVLDQAQSTGLPALVGRQFAEQMNITTGDTFVGLVPRSTGTPKMIVMQVAGFIDTGTQLDQVMAMVSLSNLQRQLGGQAISSIQLSFDDLFMARSYLYHMQVRLPQGFYGRSWQGSHGNLYQAVQTSRNLINLLLMFIIAIAAFNVISTLVLVVLDKRSDIAILRTMGASRSDILTTFLAQGASIGAIGALVGAVVGSLLALSLGPVIAALENIFDFQLLDSSIYPVSFVPIDWQLADVLQISLVAVLSALLAALYPAYRAASTNAATALRSE